MHLNANAFAFDPMSDPNVVYIPVLEPISHLARKLDLFYIQ